MCRGAGKWWRVRLRRRAGTGSAGCAGFGRHGKRGGCGAASVSAEGVAVGGVCAGWGGAGLVRGAPQVTGPIDLLWYTGRALHLAVRKRCGPEDRRKPIVTVDVLQSQLGILCAAIHVSVVEEQNDVPTLLWHATLFQLRAFRDTAFWISPASWGCASPSHFEPAGFCVTVPCTTMPVSSTAN